MKKFWLFMFLAFGLLSACGAGGPVVTTTLEVEMTEFMFNPKDLAVPAGQTVTLNLKNGGAIEHDFVILKKGMTARLPFELEAQRENILFAARLKPGQAETYTLTLAETGDYEVICSVPGHLEAGMKAKLSAR